MAKFVEWQSKYETRIPLIDKQHRHLFTLTNSLYAACSVSGEQARAAFIETAHEAVKYVKQHFSAEEKILEAVQFPKIVEHKKQHELFVKKVLEATKGFNATIATNVAYDFARFLRDWIMSHIMVNDQEYAFYILDLRQRGLISPKLDKALLLPVKDEAVK